jgi:hypothetical protein
VTDQTRRRIAPPPARSRASRAARAFIFLAAALVLAATLYPTEPMGGGARVACLVCGERGLADAVLNVILFLPLGAAAALTGLSTLAALVLGALLSGAVEFAQMTIIPGRDASLGDLVFNTLGAAGGVVILRTSHLWLGYNRLLASRLSLAAGVFAAAVIGATGLLLAPQTPDGIYFVMWRPVLTHLDPYPADVRSVTIGGQAYPPNRLDDPTHLRALLEQGAPIRVHALVAPMTSRLSGMFAIYDQYHREVVLVGPDRDDLVFRIRTRAASVLLDLPDLRLHGAWRDLIPGTALDVTVRRAGRYFCIGLGLDPPCRFGYVAGMGWALFLYIEHWQPAFQSVLALLWMAALALPIGFWARRRWETAVALAIFGLALFVLPPLVGLLATPVLHAAAAFGGIALGALLARLVVLST